MSIEKSNFVSSVKSFLIGTLSAGGVMLTAIYLAKALYPK